MCNELAVEPIQVGSYSLTPIFCEGCKRERFTKPNGDCFVCGRLISLFPAAHMDPDYVAAMLAGSDKKTALAIVAARLEKEACQRL